MNEAFFSSQPDINKACLMALRDIILKHNDAISETKKYGMPCFIFKSKPLCYLWTDKTSNEPYILFVDGQLLSHPALESEGRKRMKILKIDPYADIDVSVISELLKCSIEIRLEKH
jgi:hypothetical protein